MGFIVYLLLMNCLLHAGVIMLVGFTSGSQGIPISLTLLELCLRECVFNLKMYWTRCIKIEMKMVRKKGSKGVSTLEWMAVQQLTTF